MITREYLENRIKELTASRDKLMANVNLMNGAVQVCQQLLADLAKEADAAQAETHEVAEEGEGAKANGEGVGT